MCLKSACDINIIETITYSIRSTKRKRSNHVQLHQVAFYYDTIALHNLSQRKKKETRKEKEKGKKKSLENIDSYTRPATEQLKHLPESKQSCHICTFKTSSSKHCCTLTLVLALHSMKRHPYSLAKFMPSFFVTTRSLS